MTLGNAYPVPYLSLRQFGEDVRVLSADRDADHLRAQIRHSIPQCTSHDFTQW
jgi:hypothetical protein